MFLKHPLWPETYRYRMPLKDGLWREGGKKRGVELKEGRAIILCMTWVSLERSH